MSFFIFIFSFWQCSITSLKEEENFLKTWETHVFVLPDEGKVIVMDFQGKSHKIIIFF